MLRRLLFACGQALDVTARTLPPSPRRDQLSELLGARVDVATVRTLTPHVLNRALEEAVPL